MKIYFAGSITGGRQDAELYAQIIEYLQTKGTVLTEHIGLDSLTGSGESLSATEIHDRDMQWLMESDLVVAEVTTPSLGVGYELGRAVEVGKRIICLHRPSVGKLSCMISGSQEIHSFSYETLEEAKQILDEQV